ncbi:MAG: hypothetical protein QM655_17040 [Nocardioidaceae bacterium]
MLASTVGPYPVYGEPVVRACTDVGTDYLDLTGKPEFVDWMYLAHHATAARTGARLVHACGFDSIPHDLRAYFTVRRLAPVTAPLAGRGVVRVGGGLSGGTLHSAVGQLARAPKLAEATHARRRRLERSHADADAHAGVSAGAAADHRPGRGGA